MNSKQIDALRLKHGILEGEEWSAHGGFSPVEKQAVDRLLRASPFFRLKETYGSRVSPDGKRDYQHLEETFDIPGAHLCQFR
jgi:hypothetical protein